MARKKTKKTAAPASTPSESTAMYTLDNSPYTNADPNQVPVEAAHLTPGQHDLRPGVVSVILVNFRGADDTISCLKYFDDIDWPQDKLELIVVENGSGDDSFEKISAACPNVHVIDSGANLGFAGGCNFGVDSAGSG